MSHLIFVLLYITVVIIQDSRNLNEIPPKNFISDQNILSASWLPVRHLEKILSTTSRNLSRKEDLCFPRWRFIASNLGAIYLMDAILIGLVKFTDTVMVATNKSQKYNSQTASHSCQGNPKLASQVPKAKFIFSRSEA